MHRSGGPVRRLSVFPVLLVLGCLLQGCGPAAQGGRTAVRMNAAAFDDFGNVLGRSADDVTVPRSTLDDLARQADVDAGRVAETAQQASQPQVVQQTAETLDRRWQQVAADVGKEASVSVACDWLKGEEVTVAGIASAIGEAAQSQVTPAVQEVEQAVIELIDDWHLALNSSLPEERSAVVLMCFYAEQTG